MITKFLSLISNSTHLRNNHNNKPIFDLTRSITLNTAVFPGDPPFKVEQIESLDNGSSYGISYLHLCNHIGTHIDFPAHVIKGGKTSSDFPISYFIGTGVIINVPKNDKQPPELGITEDFINNQKIFSGDIVFFKTSNSNLSSDKLSERFVF